MIDVEAVRRFALSLPESTEQPHFEATSFRVSGKIFATVPPDDAHLHVFVDQQEIDAAVSEDPVAFQPLSWGQRVVGIRISLADAPTERVHELVEESWRRKANKRIVAAYDA